MRNAIATLRERRDSEEGFTLIELMVVVLIIGILIAIAIPTFLGAKSRANDRASQSNLRNALTAAKTWFTDNNAYPATPAAAIAATAFPAVEPSLTFQTTLSATQRQVRVDLSTATDVIMSNTSPSQKCFYIADDTAFGTGFAYVNASCTATAATPALAAAPTVGGAVAAAASPSATALVWYTSW